MLLSTSILTNIKNFYKIYYSTTTYKINLIKAPEGNTIIKTLQITQLNTPAY